ncbi:MAG: glycosyltransferase [Nitrospiraceae bacterium]
MKVLYLTDPGPDYLADQIYDGLCATFGWSNIFDYPHKEIYHEPHARTASYPQNPGHHLTAGDAASMIRERRIDLTILSSPRRGALEAYHSVAGQVDGPPVVLLDGEDDGLIRADVADAVGAGLYFKREYRTTAKSANGEWLRERLPQGDGRLDGRVHPLPFSVTAASLSSAAPEERDIDISFVGRASHRKRVRAVNLLRRTTGIRFEGGVYLDASDRRSKLAASWLGIATAKLLGDPRASASAQAGKLEPEQYRSLLRRSKMALSIRGGGFDTVRYWEIVASKTLLISEPPDIVIPHNFEHGRHAMFCRHDLRDLPTIVRRLRDDDRARLEMVEAGYRHLLEFHTSERRAAYLLDLCRRML